IEDDDPTDSLPGVSGTIGLSDGSFSLLARKLTLGNMLQVTSGLTLTHDPDAAPTDDLLRIGHATATIPALTFGGKTPTVEMTDFGVKQNGDFFLGSAQLHLPPGYINAMQLGGFVPLEITSLGITFPDPTDLNTFTIDAT